MNSIVPADRNPHHERLSALQIVVRYDPKSFQPLLPLTWPSPEELKPFFEGTFFDPISGSAQFSGGFVGGSTFPEEGILRLGLKPYITRYVVILPSAEPVPVLNLLGSIPLDAPVNTVMELAFTERQADAGTVRTELVGDYHTFGPARIPGTLRAGSITVIPRELFVRGDSNLDGRLEISDAIHMLHFLFLGGAELTCRDAADTDDDGMHSLTDSIGLLGFLFLGGPPPAGPWPECGEDPTEDGLDCVVRPGC